MPDPQPSPSHRSPSEGMAFIMAVGMMLIFGIATFALLMMGGAR